MYTLRSVQFVSHLSYPWSPLCLTWWMDVIPVCVYDCRFTYLQIFFRMYNNYVDQSNHMASTCTSIIGISAIATHRNWLGTAHLTISPCGWSTLVGCRQEPQPNGFPGKVDQFGGFWTTLFCAFPDSLIPDSWLESSWTVGWLQTHFQNVPGWLMKELQLCSTLEADPKISMETQIQARRAGVILYTMSMSRKWCSLSQWGS